MRKLLVAFTLVAALGFMMSAAVPAPSYAGPETSITATVVAQAPAAPEKAAQAKKITKVEANKTITITMFIIIVLITMYIVYWAAKRTKTTADFYAARGAITGTQNGWAIAGDYMSAASFLGIAGLICLYGYDGFMYSVGWLVAYVTVLLIVAEPCRNAGKYTMGDILAFRSSPRPVRAAAAFSTVLVSIFYLTAQMVGAGKLMELLLGIPFRFAISGVGCLMIVYVALGGMIATTWVQIVKAGLLMSGATVLCVLVSAKAGFNPVTFFHDIATSQQIQDWVRIGLLKDAVPQAGFDYGQRFLEPGLLLKDVWDQISLGMALVLGTAGMPHILMRFFTVPTAQEARKSVIIAMFIIGTFYILTTLLGFGSAIHVTPQLSFAVDKGGNMSNMLLAQMLGNEIYPLAGDVLLAFLCAVAFATILAVVSGLVLASAAAISHDIYVSVIKGGKAEQREQVRAARIASICVGACAVVIGILAEGQNVAHLVALAFAVASAGNLPTVVLSLFWRKMSTAGIVAGLVIGVVASIGLVLVSPNMQYPKAIAAGDQKIYTGLEKKQAGGATLTEVETKELARAKASYEKNKNGTSFIFGLDKPLYGLKNPGIVSIPMGFLAAIIFSLLFPSKKEEDAFDELYVRQNTGVGVAEAIGH
ncbi:MAG: cation acetate symporter [Desulfomonile tiedjei]|nr:cation acetate symporter [Desulfomonile tiedjei]